MKKIVFYACIALVFFCACSKQGQVSPDEDGRIKTDGGQFYVKYSIYKGRHYSNKNSIEPLKASSLSFKVKFDSSAIYSSLNPENQTDINKLFGFSDNNAAHHLFSARFGWRWSDDSLRLFAYTYNEGERRFQEIGIIQPGVENDCSIAIKEDNYIFSLNGAKTAMPRASSTPIAEGYKLYPYFGGDESAPHDIFIWIKEVKTQEENQ